MYIYIYIYIYKCAYIRIYSTIPSFTGKLGEAERARGCHSAARGHFADQRVNPEPFVVKGHSKG